MQMQRAFVGFPIIVTIIICWANRNGGSAAIWPKSFLANPDFRSPDPSRLAVDDRITRFFGTGLYSVPLPRLNKPFTFVKN